MSDRYFCESPISGTIVTLQGGEAHHIARVMRLGPGDQVTLFDGRGAEYLAELDEVDKRQVTLNIVRRIEANRELPFTLSVACALPKGDRQKLLVEKLVELGATRLIPLETERGVAQPVEKAIQRLQRAVIESSKQCGRNRLMQIEFAQPLHELLTNSPDAARWIAHPQGEPMAVDSFTKSDAVVIAIGPEGGFTDEELQSAVEAGWRSVGLGPRILRVETAAMAVTACLSLLQEGSGNGSA